MILTNSAKYAIFITPMLFVHGASTASLESIKAIGLAPPITTDLSTEKRQSRLDVVYLLDQKYTKLAGGYALRSTMHFGGKPILIFGEVPDNQIQLAIPGRNAFPDIYTTSAVMPEQLSDIVDLEASIEDISELFKAHKS